MSQAWGVRVFDEEVNAVASQAAANLNLDADRFDAFCDHLIVVRQIPDTADERFRLDDGEMVGTYRLLRQQVAAENGGFYTQGEFDLAPLLAAKPDLNFLELGRSCVLKPFRTKPVIELLWQGIWNYVRHFKLDVMMGCASLEGADPGVHKNTLNFLARNCAAPVEWKVRALPCRHVEMTSADAIADAKAALQQLPPLIKGYLRLGCYIGDGAVVDGGVARHGVLLVGAGPAFDAGDGRLGDDDLLGDRRPQPRRPLLS